MCERERERWEVGSEVGREGSRRCKECGEEGAEVIE